MTTNVTDVDSFIFHRKGTRASSYYKTTASQLSEYFRDVYSAELDTLIAEVEEIKKDSIEGDTLINDRIDAYADRVKVAADNIFPILMDGYWSYKMDLVANSTFRYNYNSCVTGVDLLEPIIEPDPDECLEKHALKFYQEVLGRDDNTKNAEFYALTPDADQMLSRTTHIVISDRPLNTVHYPGGNGDINWETKVVEGDILQIASTKRTATGAVVVEDEHYAMYLVVSVYNEPTTNGEEPFSLVKVTHIGGPDVAFNPVFAYQIKVMKSLTETLGADFVQIVGDTMTGALIIDADTTNNPRTLYNKGEAHTRTLKLGEIDDGTKVTLLGPTPATVSVLSDGLNVTTLDTEENQVRITNDGVKTFNPILYSAAFNLNKAEHVTYRGYVDDADVLLDQKIAQVNERIDTISDVIEKQRFVMTFATDCWTSDTVVAMDAWLSCMAANLTSNQDLSNKKTIYPKPATAHNSNGVVQDLNVTQVDALLVSSEALDDDGILLSVEPGDTIELQLVIDDNSPAGTEPQIIRYIAAALPTEVDDGSELASQEQLIDSEQMYLISLSGQNSSLGANTFYEDSTYIFKHFPKNQGIKVEDADQRYLTRIGDDYREGTTDLRNSPGVSDKDALVFTDPDDGATPLKIKATGQAIFTGPNAEFRPAPGIASTDFIRVQYNKIDFGNAIRLHRDNAAKLEITGTTTDFKLNKLIGITTPAYSDAGTTGITIDFFKDNFHQPLVAGVGITLVQDTENKTITINAPANNSRSLASLNDVSVSGSLTGGETLVYDAAVGKWVLSDVSTLLQGISVMASEEHEARVGGVWTDGSNFYLRVE